MNITIENEIEVHNVYGGIDLTPFTMNIWLPIDVTDENLKAEIGRRVTTLCFNVLNRNEYFPNLFDQEKYDEIEPKFFKFLK